MVPLVIFDIYNDGKFYLEANMNIQITKEQMIKGESHN